MHFNLATVFDTIADAVADRDAIVFRDRRLTYRQLQERTNRLAHLLASRGYGCHAGRGSLEDFESGQDHLGLYLYNGNEYLEGMLGAFKARLAPFNVNYRYVDEELLYLLNNASTKALIFHSSLAQHVESIRDQVPSLELLLQVRDDDRPLVEGALDFEEALAASDPLPPNIELPPDDLYVIYTGGTTGMPKGVLWKQSDILIASLGGTPRQRQGDAVARRLPRPGTERRPPPHAGATLHARRRPLDRLPGFQHRRHGGDSGRGEAL